VTEPTEQGDENLWTRLRRRKVVQWVLAYAAGAWTLLQVLEYLGETYGWPPAIRQVATPALALGVLFVIVLAWYHGDKGEQRATRAELAMLVLLASAIGALLWWYASQLDSGAWVAASGQRETERPSAVDARSIAVLPFVDMSPRKDQAYFSDGLADELLSLLTRVPQLRVTSRTSSFSFKGRDVPIATIARELHVAHVLEGSVRMSGERVRITAELIDARSDVNVWSATYDRTLDDVFAVQDEVAAAVAAALKVRLLGASAPSSTRTSPEAYTMYLQGKELVDSASPKDRANGIALLQRSLAVAPDYAPAWTQLGRAYWTQTALSEIPLKGGTDLARGAVAKALVADPQYAPAYALLAGIERDYEWNFASARQHLQTAMTLAPADSTVLRSVSRFVSYIGSSAEAVRIARWIVARDPLNADSLGELASALYQAGQYEEAERLTLQALALKPGRWGNHYFVGQCRLLRGDPAGALEENDKEPVETLRQFGRSVIYPSLGRRQEARAILEELGQQHSDWSIALAEGYAALGDKTEAFRWLERGFVERDPGMPQLRTDPLLGSLHDDPRWEQILERIGLSDRHVAALGLDVTLP